MTQAESSAARALFQEGRETWPQVHLSWEVFAAFVAERESETPIAELRGADLYLVCACLARDESATRSFSEEFTRDIERAAARIRQSGLGSEDVRQMLLHQILLGDGERPAKLVSYSGRGSLRNWVRAVAARASIDLHRRGGGREVAAGEGLFEKLTDASDPEMQYFKRHYREELKAAFEAAVKDLSARERNTLRHLFIECLTIDQMAALYSIHRSTAARRMSAARDSLLQGTRTALCSRLKVDGDVLDSIMRLIDSHFDLSVHRVLAVTETTSEDQAG